MLKKMAILICLFALVGLGHSEPVQVEKDGQIFTIEAERIEGILHISVSDLAKIFGSEIYFNPITKKAVVKIENHSAKLSLFSPFIEIDQTPYNLTYPVQLKNGDFYLALVTLVPMLELICTQKVFWDERQMSLRFEKKELNLLGYQATEKSNGVVLEIFLTENLQYEIYTSENRWININFFSAKVNEVDFPVQNNSPVTEIKFYPLEISTQLSFRLNQTFVNYLDEVLTDPLRLQISISTSNHNSNSNGNPKNSPKNFDNLVDVIVIDAGHGGQDYGAVGPTGLAEKDVALDIALRVEKLLVKEGFKVILTRKDDTFIPLADRTQIANSNGTDLFISIHANSSRKRNISGSETYFLAQAKNDEARAVAALENSSLRFEQENPEELSDLDFILLDLVQNQFLKESSDLAYMIQENMERKLPIANRGVDQAGFFVLNKAYMPAVLVETAFISNKSEEKLLKSSSFKQKIAEGVLSSILNFKEKYEALAK
ncbi:MAG TPA: N-acetylmuramoyl-L-alanine amidase [candidate division Zixibacteria bacterium]|nr:N-acetylmuramoyl-L-alanine amidase [candidate division Zixibacteria bacterium]